MYDDTFIYPLLKSSMSLDVSELEIKTNISHKIDILNNKKYIYNLIL